MKLRCKPNPHQIDGGKFLYARRAAALQFATGTGKSLIEIIIAFAKLRDKKADKWIFVGTVSSKIEIQTDFLKFTDTQPYIATNLQELEWFMKSTREVCIIQWNEVAEIVYGEDDPQSQNRAMRLAKLQASQNLEPEDKAWLNQYTLTRTAEIQRKKQKFVEVLSLGRTGWCLDEFHTIKNPESSVRMAFDVARPFMSYVYGFTATTVMKDVYDLYWLVNYLDPKVLGSLDEFNARWVDRERSVGGRRKMTWKVKGFRNLEMLNIRLATVMMSYFPKREIDWNVVETDLPPEAEGPYLEAAKGVFEVEEGTGRKQHSARLNDLQTVVNGTWAKQKAFLLDLRGKLPQGALVFCAFYETVDTLKPILDRYSKQIEYRLISGKQSSDERRANRDWFCSNPAGKVLIITRAGGQSLNLHATPNLIFYDIPFGVGYFLQTIGRVVRDFGPYSIFNITFIVLKGTIDEYKMQLVSAQKELFQKVFNNEALPSSPEFETFSSQVVERLRRELLWKIGGKRT